MTFLQRPGDVPNQLPGTSLERQIKTSPGRHFKTSPGCQIGTFPGRSNRIFRGRPGDVGGGRPRDVLGTNIWRLGVTICQYVKAITLSVNRIYNVRNIFCEKSDAKCDGETIPRPFSKNSKSSISLVQ